MAIHRIDDVKINGRNQAFGAYIYAVDYDVSVTDVPSKVIVNFVNESGDYLEPELSVTKPYKIEIGNIVAGNFYAISRTINKSSGGRTMEVVFHDGSLILDRLWVGLYKRMADDTVNVPGLIIVGRELHPCDVNEDGVFDQADADLLSWKQLDPCELRCPTDSKYREPVVENCAERELLEIFDVKYSFGDLLDALSGGGAQPPATTRAVSYPVEADLAAGTVSVNLNLPPVKKHKNSNPLNRVKIKQRPRELNNFYLNSYTGTLRDVLRNWCADFGWTFYWENDSLNFIDTKERPKINRRAFSNLESTNDTRTLEGTVGRGFVSHYAQQGIRAQQDCQQSRPMLLKCLTLGDLFGEYYKPAWNAVVPTQGDYASTSSVSLLSPPIPEVSDTSPDNQNEYIDDIYPNGVPIAKFEASCVCAYYSDTLRHLYNLWNYYGIKNQQDAETIKGKWLDRLGQIKILNVFGPESANGSDAYSMYATLRWGTVGFNEGKALLSKEEGEIMDKYGGYFAVVLRHRARPEKGEDILDKQARIEERLSNEFIGQHWYRAYVSPFLGETPQIFPNGQYFGALSTNVKDLPFAAFGHTYKSNVSKMVSSFAQRQRNDYRPYGNLSFARPYAKNTSKKLVRSLLYFNRSPSDAWLPLKNADLQTHSLFKDLGYYDIKVQSTKGLNPTDFNSLVTVAGNRLIDKKFDQNVELWVMFKEPPSGFKIESSFKTHPNPERPQYTESLEPFTLATVGLLSNRCAAYNINGLTIYTPVAGSVTFEEQPKFKWLYREPEAKEFDQPAYKVYVSNTVKNRGLVPKTETTMVEVADASQAVKIDYQIKELGRDALQLINKLTEKCELSLPEIRKLHEKLSTNLSFSVTEPFNSISYRVFGVTLPSPVSIKEGLQSLKVRFGDNGVFTDVTIGDSLFTPPSVDVITRALELGIDPKLANLRKNAL